MITANLHVTVAGELVTIRPIWQRCEGEGLECPQEVFTQHEEANNADFGAIVRAVDWERVRFPVLHSGRSASIAVIQYALDEARDRARQFGIVDGV